MRAPGPAIAVGRVMATRSKKKPGAWATKSHTLTLNAITRCARRTSRRRERPAWHNTPLAEALTAQAVVRWAREVGRMHWSAVFVVLAYIVAAFVMFPRPLLTLLSIIAYGAWAGFGVAMAGIVGSALAVYYAGR